MRIDFLYGVFPYVAVGLLAAGTIIRCLLLRNQSATVSAEISQAWLVFGTGRLWQISVLLLICGHLIVVTTPQIILLWNANRLRLYVLEAAAFGVGLSALAGWLALMWRNLKRRTSPSLAELLDTVLLALAFIGIVSGMLCGLLYRWGSSWGAMILTPYFVSLLNGRPAVSFVLQMPFLVQLHVFTLFAAVAVIPATRLGAAIAGAVRATMTWACKPLSVSRCAIAAWVRKHSLASLFWPEED